ncbi:hypothetical protein EG68_10695 [Paragonimus skrjabini miyazakii]|uniref:Uncharacterized protein n=1 Tax=Paragonimus skrjabini miyazakii TaxID=59628 RepID=A0A8S9YQ22_9TREM|nr:hypothetical protein EG68_10695 [Paragonimus skrjabini miyazakii]
MNRHLAVGLQRLGVVCTSPTRTFSKETKVLDLPRHHGIDVMRDPGTNKGTAFLLHERQLLGIHGLLPPAVLTMDQQVDKPEWYFHWHFNHVVSFSLSVLLLPEWAEAVSSHDLPLTVIYLAVVITN